LNEVNSRKRTEPHLRHGQRSTSTTTQMLGDDLIADRETSNVTGNPLRKESLILTLVLTNEELKDGREVARAPV
jgi:hypothetical protein